MSTRDISLTSNENSAVILRFVPFYLTYLWLPLRFFYHWFEQFYFDMLWCFLFLVLEVCSASWICVCRVYIKFGRILVNMFFIHSSVLFFGDSNFVCFKPLAVVSQVTNALFSLLEDSFFFLLLFYFDSTAMSSNSLIFSSTMSNLLLILYSTYSVFFQVRHCSFISRSLNSVFISPMFLLFEYMKYSYNNCFIVAC